MRVDNDSRGDCLPAANMFFRFTCRNSAADLGRNQSLCLVSVPSNVGRPSFAKKIILLDTSTISFVTDVDILDCNFRASNHKRDGTKLAIASRICIVPFCVT